MDAYFFESGIKHFALQDSFSTIYGEKGEFINGYFTEGGIADIPIAG